jgi:excisionase family DNA binding protein
MTYTAIDLDEVQQMIEHHRGFPHITCSVSLMDAMAKEIADLRSQLAAWETDAVVFDISPRAQYDVTMEVKEMRDKSDPLLRPVVCAREADVTTRTICNLCEKGELEGVKVGRQWRIRRSVWDTYLGRREA